MTQSESATERKELQEQVLPQLKASLENWCHLQQQQQPGEADAEEQLRSEQAKLSELESFLDKLDKSLSEFGPH